MVGSGPKISLIVPTIGRSEELARLFDSLVIQEFQNFEIIVVDQNRDDRTLPVIEAYKSKLKISHLRTVGRRGISAAKNDGLRQTKGEIVAFPDDDCWFPRSFLGHGLEVLETKAADLVSGRFADETGRSINGRLASRAQRITRRNVWFTQSEAASFYRRESLERIGGFDEILGVGAPSPWQAAEGPDLILRALPLGFTCYYDPELYGFHREYDLDDPSADMPARGRAYGRGMGFVLRRHKYCQVTALLWILRPLFTALTSILTGRLCRAAYGLSVSAGRAEGWLGRVWNIMRAPSVLDFGAESQTPKIQSPRIAMDSAQNGLATYGEQQREMTGPYRVRNPLLVSSLYLSDALGRLLPKRQKTSEPGRPLRLLVANWGHLGDVVTILPLLKLLSEHPNVAHLGVLIGSWSRPVLAASDIKANIHCLDHWALDRQPGGRRAKILRYFSARAKIIRELKASNYDAAIDTFASFPSTHGITWSARIGRRIGFTSSGLGSLLTDPHAWVPDDQLMLDHQLKLLDSLPELGTPNSLSASYPGITAKRATGPTSGPYLVLHMGPPNIRGWVPEKWTELASALTERGYRLVATGTSGEEAEAAKRVNRTVPLQDLTGRLNWEEFVNTISGAQAVVTIDSIAAHVAACFKIPTVVLTAGRQRLTLWRPNQPGAVVVTHPVGCAPCHRSDGCDAMACVRLIEVADVLSAVDEAIGSDWNTHPTASTPKMTAS